MKFKDLKVGQSFRFSDQSMVWTKEAEDWDDGLYGPANCRDENGNGAYANAWDSVEVVE